MGKFSEAWKKAQKTSMEKEERKRYYGLTYKEFLEKKKELDEQGVVYCPKCLSQQITSNKKGFGFGKALVGGLATGGIGLLAGGIGSKKVEVTCLRCGHKWKAGK